MNLFEKNNPTQIPSLLPLVPMIDVVIFPHMVLPLLILDEKILRGIHEAYNQGNKLVTVVACKKNNTMRKSFSVGTQDLYRVGTVVQIIKIIPTNEEGGGTKILVQGVCRAFLKDIEVANTLYADIEVLLYDETYRNQNPYKEKIEVVRSLIQNIGQSNNIHRDFSFLSQVDSDFEKIAEFIISYLSLSFEESQKLLEANSIKEFLDKSITLLKREIEISKIQEKAKNKARESISVNQREFYVREQIRALKEELGETTEEIDSFRQKLYSLEDTLPEESFKEILQCINRLENMSPEGAEAGVLKTYLDCVFNLPWELETKDSTNIAKVKKMLDDEHYGLSQIKEKVLDFLSVKQLSKNALGTILCFYGPPGVGKTSLAQSIAKAMGRKCVRISVGGMKDEAEIRGHRRTYVGAMMGRIMKGLLQEQVNNPLIVVDEIDKIGAEFRGDPAAALLEVFDYKQNSSFSDHYLGIPFDLSKVFFIATANNIAAIPEALRDRMDLVELHSYSFEEKKHIAKNYLIKKMTKECGLPQKAQKIITDDVLYDIIIKYTYESGVRELERTIRQFYYKVARYFVENNVLPSVSQNNLVEYLGFPRYHFDSVLLHNKIGVSNGLCYAPCGGEVIHIETILLPGNGKLLLTGQLGDVMKESARIAFNLLRSKTIDAELKKRLDSSDFHVHVPAGGIKKDGPSAGVAFFASLMSALKKEFLHGTIAMTGEIDLQGRVLPVGGIKEKLLAAKRNNITTILLPKNNSCDVKEIEHLVDGLTITYLDRIEESIPLLFLSQEEQEDLSIGNVLPEATIDEMIEAPSFQCKK
jgi:ATP-dependent Lon protease